MKNSLILNYDNAQKNITIIDCHHNKTLKTFYATTEEKFTDLDKLVRNGTISFEYLMNESIQNIEDIKFPALYTTDNLAIGDAVMYNGTEFVITLFNFGDKPITVDINNSLEQYTVKIKDVIKLTEHIDGHEIKGRPQSHFDMTMAGPAPAPEPEHTGGSSSYYMTYVANPTTLDTPYRAECNDIIEALELTYAEANVIKAVWRIAAARQGKKKKGNNSVYDAEKIIFFGKRMKVHADEH